MAIVYWQGPNTSGSRWRSGTFGTAANWSNGTTPGADDTVILPTGRYTVTVADSAEIAALSVAKSATLLVEQGDPMSLGIAGDSSNAGTIRLAGCALRLGGTLTNTGVIEGQSSTTGDRLTGGTVVNDGLLDTYGRGAWIVASTIDNRTDGVFRSDAGYGLLMIGTLANAGLVEAVDASFGMRLSDLAGTVTNLTKSVLVGGHWRAAGTGSIELVGTPVAELRGGADVVLDGHEARFAVDDGSEIRQLDETLTRISTGAALHVLGGRDFGDGQRLDVFGTLELAGGTLNTSDLEAGLGSTLVGYGTVAGAANVRGAMSVVGGTLRFEGSATVDGSVSGGGVLTFAGKDNRVLGDADVSVGTLELTGGTTRFETVDVHARALVIDGATLNFGAGQLTATGSVDLDDALVFGSSLRLARGELASSGASRLAVDVVNTGTIAVDDGVLTIDGKLSGAGDVSVHDGATLRLGEGAAAGRAQVIALDGAATLEIAAPGNLAAAIAGFDRGDTIAVSGFTAADTRLRWLGDADGAGGTLRVIGATSTVALHFDDGAYVRRNFSLFDFGSGELGITFQPTRSSGGQVASEAFGSDTHSHLEHLFLGGATLHTDGSFALV